MLKNQFDYCKYKITSSKAFRALANRRGEAYVGTVFKILIAVMLGALLLAGLYLLMDKTVLPELTKKVTEIFTKTSATPGS